MRRQAPGCCGCRLLLLFILARLLLLLTAAPTTAIFFFIFPAFQLTPAPPLLLDLTAADITTNPPLTTSNRPLSGTPAHPFIGPIAQRPAAPAIFIFFILWVRRQQQLPGSGRVSQLLATTSLFAAVFYLFFWRCHQIKSRQTTTATPGAQASPPAGNRRYSSSGAPSRARLHCRAHQPRVTAALPQAATTRQVNNRQPGQQLTLLRQAAAAAAI